MTSFIVRRLLALIPVLLLASIAVWGIGGLLPGDPALVLAGPGASMEQVEVLRRQLGLDQPQPVQYANWLRDVVQGDFGVSARGGFPVSSLLIANFFPTLQLAVSAVIIATAIGAPVGAVAAMRPGSVWERAADIYASLTLAVPPFWVGILLLLVWGEGVGSGLIPAFSQYVSILDSPAAALRNTAGPAISLALFISGIIARFVKAAMRAASSAEYVQNAEAKGLSSSAVAVNHIAPNAAIPVVTVLGLQLGGALGGVVVVEAVFNYPGLGLLALDAVVRRDLPVLQGVVLLAVATFLVLNVAVDMTYAALDPRVRIDGDG